MAAELQHHLWRGQLLQGEQQRAGRAVPSRVVRGGHRELRAKKRAVAVLKLDRRPDVDRQPPRRPLPGELETEVGGAEVADRSDRVPRRGCGGGEGAAPTGTARNAALVVCASKLNVQSEVRSTGAPLPASLQSCAKGWAALSISSVIASNRGTSFVPSSPRSSRRWRGSRWSRRRRGRSGRGCSRPSQGSRPAAGDPEQYSRRRSRSRG